MALQPGGGRDPRSYPPRPEGAKPGHSLSRPLWSPALDALPPLGAQWPPGYLFCPVSGHPAIMETLKEPHGAEPACGGLGRTRGTHPCLPLLHTELTHGLGLRQAGPPASITPSPVSGAQGGRVSAFPGTRDTAWGCWKEFWAPSLPRMDQPCDVGNKPPGSGPQSPHLSVVDMGSLESSRI